MKDGVRNPLKEGGDAEWAVCHPPLMFSENCVHQRRRRNRRDGLHAQQKTQIHVDQGYFNGVKRDSCCGFFIIKGAGKQVKVGIPMR